MHATNKPFAIMTGVACQCPKCDYITMGAGRPCSRTRPSGAAFDLTDRIRIFQRFRSTSSFAQRGDFFRSHAMVSHEPCLAVQAYSASFAKGLLQLLAVIIGKCPQRFGFV